MGRSQHAIAAAALAGVLSGCGCGPAAEEERAQDRADERNCDRRQLASLSQELEPLSPWAASQRVWPGLLASCDDAVPGELTVPSPEGNRPPVSDPEVLTEQESQSNPAVAVEVLGLHQWLLDQGLEREAAVPITRALLTLRWAQALGPPLPPGFELPEANGDSLGTAHVVGVTSDAVYYDDVRLDAVGMGFVVDTAKNSSLIPGLSRPLADETDARKEASKSGGAKFEYGELTLLLDARTPYETLCDVARTTYMYWFENLHLVTAAERGGLATIRLRPGTVWGPSPGGAHLRYKSLSDDSDFALEDDPGRLPADLPIRKTPFLAIELGADTFALYRPHVDPDERTWHGATDLDAITEAARELAQASPPASSLVISAEPQIPLSRVVEAISAARGPECREGQTGCYLTDVVLMRQDAHDYRFPGWPTAEQESEMQVYFYRKDHEYLGGSTDRRMLLDATSDTDATADEAERMIEDIRNYARGQPVSATVGGIPDSNVVRLRWAVAAGKTYYSVYLAQTGARWVILGISAGGKPPTKWDAEFEELVLERNRELQRDPSDRTGPTLDLGLDEQAYYEAYREAAKAHRSSRGGG